ncbi:hypothetical protein NQ176_g5692 [Zarea fungicola]|uniref:Uncharacterized protein n=1 Tax=Zarea fungicola TaxID=93591 RepID=A0ACC1N780_9HYPO|nr:hypothetical protein NQ176_g5692 [Lecanicillium fungicola]
MTNTKICDPEIIEKRYPIILREFSIRDGSGGQGRWNGGNGVRRVYEFRRDMGCSVVSERRVTRPYGMKGGEDGKCGVNYVVKGGDGGRWCRLGGRKDVQVSQGDWLVIDTPGGGAWGSRLENVEDVDSANKAKTNGVQRRFLTQFQLAQESSN